MAYANTCLVRVAAGTPKIKVADIGHNKEEILKIIKDAKNNDAAFLVLPELTISGYTIGDIVFQSFFYEKQIDALFDIVEATEESTIIVILGCYVKVKDNYYNCSAVIRDGQILGIVPKRFNPNSHEFMEKRWFASGNSNVLSEKEILLCGRRVPFGPTIFTDEYNDISFAAEVCRDLWVPISPGTMLAMAGAHIIFNSSASNDFAGKADRRRRLVSEQSCKSMCGYVYASSGVGESSTDVVFSGHQLVAECGKIIAENGRFERISSVIYSEIDINRIKVARLKENNFLDCANSFGQDFSYNKISIRPVKTVEMWSPLMRSFSKNPLLPKQKEEAKKYCADVFAIQAAALAKRIEHIGTKKVVIGVSGGLDSTLALLVAAEALSLIGLPTENIIAITLPGFGTTDRTHDNAVAMMKYLKVDMREISIKKSVLAHFEDIGHDPENHDLTYENAQARERTQILMDVAGKEGALMIGTGDLSETALGWCTFNGDHMSMYGVNGSVPKTLIPHVLQYVMETRYSDMPELGATIQSVIDTPISPELLPPSKEGDIQQKTENSIGPYQLHDFFIYYTVEEGMPPAQLLYLASETFKEEYDVDTIKKWMQVFYKRFFSQQFKRNASVDCPMATCISLSPRCANVMPSDASGIEWIKELENL